MNGDIAISATQGVMRSVLTFHVTIRLNLLNMNIRVFICHQKFTRLSCSRSGVGNFWYSILPIGSIFSKKHILPLHNNHYSYQFDFSLASISVPELDEAPVLKTLFSTTTISYAQRKRIDLNSIRQPSPASDCFMTSLAVLVMRHTLSYPEQ